MKTTKIIKLLATLTFSMLLSLTVSAQNPPDPPDGHGDTDDNPPGGDAPLAEATFLLLGLGAAYGTGKVYKLSKKD